jgi:hypothetical protein
LPGSNPALIDAIRAIISISGLTASNVSYAYIENSVPIAPRSGRSASVKGPYLQIKFTAQSLDALKKGVLEGVDYWLKGDAAEYVQTYTNGGLKLADVTMTDETPAGGNDTGKSGGGGGGCDAGLVGFAAAIVLLGAVAKREK